MPYKNYKDKLKYMQKYYLENIDKIKSNHKIWYQKNKKERNRKDWIKKNERKKYDKAFAIKIRLKDSLHYALETYGKREYKSHSKYGKYGIYGIDFNAIIEHLKPFPKDISKYHIDHIIPLSFFDLTNLEEIKQAYSPKNHQWLTIQENLKKSDKLIYNEQ